MDSHAKTHATADARRVDERSCSLVITRGLEYPTKLSLEQSKGRGAEENSPNSRGVVGLSHDYRMPRGGEISKVITLIVARNPPRTRVFVTDTDPCNLCGGKRVS